MAIARPRRERKLWSIGPKVEMYMEGKRMGAMIQVVIPAVGIRLSTDSSSIHIYNRQPHSNAAKVFINLMFLQEAQSTLKLTCIAAALAGISLISGI